MVVRLLLMIAKRQWRFETIGTYEIQRRRRRNELAIWESILLSHCFGMASWSSGTKRLSSSALNCTNWLKTVVCCPRERDTQTELG